MATPTYVVSHTTALAVGLVAGLAGAGITTRAAIPAEQPGVVEFDVGPAAAQNVEDELVTLACAQATTKLDGCAAGDFREVTFRWPQDGSPVTVAGRLCTNGTLTRAGGSGVPAEVCTPVDFPLTAAAAGRLATWLSNANRVCTAAFTERMGGVCSPATDAREATMRWQPGGAHVVFAGRAAGTFVRGDPQ